MEKQKLESKQNAVLRHIMTEMHPEIVQAVDRATTPLSSDLSLVKHILCEVEYREGKPSGENMHVFCAVFMRVYCPVRLYYPKLAKLDNGLRGQFSEYMGFNHATMFNYFLDSTPVHYKNPRYAQRINQMAVEIIENLKITGGEMENKREKPASARPVSKIVQFPAKNDAFSQGMRA